MKQVGWQRQSTHRKITKAFGIATPDIIAHLEYVYGGTDTTSCGRQNNLVTNGGKTSAFKQHEMNGRT